QATLKRGYAIIRDTSGQLVRSSLQAVALPAIRVTFADGDVTAAPIDGDTPPPAPKPKPAPRKKGEQGNLF
ncbi:MAG: hypothetical protein B7X53_15930, partial [Hyphomonas sp. 34-62-18]